MFELLAVPQRGVPYVQMCHLVAHGFISVI
jgi:hypothetical protein